MKFISILFVFFYFSSIIKAQNKEIPIDSIDYELRANAFQYAFGALNYCELSDFPKLDESKATSRFLNRFIPQRIYDMCDWLFDRFGKVKSVKLKNFVIDSLDRIHFRYKANYAEFDRVVDFRVVFNKENKVHWMHYQTHWDEDFSFFSDEELQVVRIDDLPYTLMEQHKEFVLSNYQYKDSTFLNYIKPELLAYPKKVKSWTADIVHERDSIYTKLGDFENLKLKEKLISNNDYLVYRYSVNFDKLDDPSEVRLYCDLKDRYVGVRVVDIWCNEYYKADASLKERIAKDIIKGK
ncbi:hypothetical protein ITJ86_06720 [Winogradskyella sp. F6397]|uniref:DUF3828 domain-containing protein n=1 Tax=Winogradskyella marina TaxID=2785530 RepID=A0ABS0EGL4_9FLAO|nr:hypothetical protein [Winogradskyella marina]MBF8149584.1 hypothetical protein [Winogradskyella marina]